MKNNKKIKKYFDAGPSMKDQFFTFTGEFSMTTLERLQKDSAELDNFVDQLSNEGKTELEAKIKAKKKFLEEKVKQLTEIAA